MTYSNKKSQRFIASYIKNHDAIYDYCLARTDSSFLAEKITEETFILLWGFILENGKIEQEKEFLLKTAATITESFLTQKALLEKGAFRLIIIFINYRNNFREK